VCAKRLEKPESLETLGEDGPLDVQSVFLNGVTHPQASLRAVSREERDFYELAMSQFVEGQHFLDEWECDSRLERHLLVVKLVLVKGSLPFVLVDFVFFFERKKRSC
jgi:hypothetical protein